ncbi:MAG TPA: NAD(P)/FAD-dependent oxidoreductase [bacterium]|nr:NAD(P)/FAD-dependent oxidoreductase [bacterium]
MARTSGAQNWAIVGGGMLGLTLALRLRQQGKSVTVLEAGPQLGGLAAPWQLGGITWDRHYHVTLLSDSALRAVLRELDLDNEIDWKITRTGFYAGGHLYPMSNALEYLRLPALGMVDKLRIAKTIVRGSWIRDWKSLEKIPVEDWLVRLSGRSAFQKLWLPLLRAKLGESYRETNAAFIWATIQRLYAARRSGLKREMFGTVRGGYARVIERFGQRLARAGVEIRCGARVERIASGADGRPTIEFADRACETFDGVVVTAAPPLASRLCPSLDAQEAERLKAIRYQGIVCASVLLSRPLAGYYLTYITDSDCPFTAIIEMTALVDPQQLGGKTLVYLPKYVSASDPFFALPDEEVQERFLTALERMIPQFQRQDVLAFRISRVPAVFPIPSVRYSEKLASRESSLPGLYWVSSANIVNGTLNVNETVQLAEETAQWLGSLPPTPAPHESAGIPEQVRA